MPKPKFAFDVRDVSLNCSPRAKEHSCNLVRTSTFASKLVDLSFPRSQSLREVLHAGHEYDRKH
jgi:hypothetical protein